MVARSGLMVLLALVLAGVGGWGIARLPTAFIPNEDQGYLMIGGAAARRRLARPHRQRRSTRRRKIAAGDAGRRAGRGDHRHVGARQHARSSPMPASPSSCSTTGACAARRRARTSARSPRRCMQAAAGAAGRPRLSCSPPPPIQGIGNAGGLPDAGRAARRQLRSRASCRAPTDEVVEQARTQTSIANPFTTFRAGAPHIELEVDRAKAETLNVSVGDVFATLSAYVGSTYVNQLQQVRPEPAGLRPGRFAVPRPARGPAAC